MNRLAPALVLVLVLATLFSLGCFAHQYRTNPRVAVVDGDPIVQMKPQGEFPVVFDAPLVPAQRRSDRPKDRERVVGAVFHGEARAYPIGLLDRFEVVNDRAGDLAFVVARCPLADVAAIYDRRIGDRTLSFENSGALWRDTLVLRDRETGTYWTAATGRALSGPLAGEQLRVLPAQVTRSEVWDRAHPDSFYLDLNRSTVVPMMMRIYDTSPAQGFSGARTSDRRYKPKEKLLAVWDGSEALVFTAGEIEGHGPIAATLGGKPITIEWDSALETPRACGEAPNRSEQAIVPMYWFAIDRHFQTVRTLGEALCPESAD